MNQGPLSTSTEVFPLTVNDGGEIQKVTSYFINSGNTCLSVRYDPHTNEIIDLYIGSDEEKAAKTFEHSWEEKHKRHKKESWLRTKQITYFFASVIKAIFGKG